jgi:type II restriction enzyme
MEFQDLVNLYELKKKQKGSNAYRYVSEVLAEAKGIHERDFATSETARRAKEEGRSPDHEQSWRAFKGKNLEKLIMYIIEDEVRSIGLKIINGNALERTNSNNLSRELSTVKRNLLVSYGEFGYHLPDVDMVIYRPENLEILAVISSKVTLRERIAQTGYWKIKLASDEATKHIKVFFVTPDEDGTLTNKKPSKKGRAIVEIDTDGSYVLSEAKVEESDKVKMLDKFIEDLRRLI